MTTSTSRIPSMPSSLTDLPAEPQLTVFAGLKDLDGALLLSVTCKSIRGLYTYHRKAIQRQIIVGLSLVCMVDDLTPYSSYLTYINDLALSLYDKVNSDLAIIYAKAGKPLPDEKRPTESVIKQCMKTHGQEMQWPTKSSSVLQSAGKIQSNFRNYTRTNWCRESLSSFVLGSCPICQW